MTTLNLQVSASSDDARQDGSTMDLTNTVIKINQNDRIGGFRFLSPTGLQGSTIDTATVQIYITSTANDDPDLVIRGDKANAPATFTTTNNDITDRTDTTASASINAIGVGSGWYSLPSLVSVVQEIADNASFTDEAIAIFLYGQSASSVQIRSYDQTPSQSAKLDIDFTTNVTISVNTLTLVGSTPNSSVSPGGASVVVDTLAIAGSAQALGVMAGSIVPLNTLTLDSSNQSLSVLPGAVSVTVSALTLVGSAQVTSVSILTIVSLSTLYLTASPESFSPPIPNFPGAQGAGAYTIGGRGGSVLFVDNLNNSGTGSFREAMEASGPRIIVPRVAGTIELSSPVDVRSPYCTFAGQAAFRAGGEGLTIKGAPLRIQTHDVVVRYLRMRPGPFMTDLYGGSISYEVLDGVDIYSDDTSADRRVYNVILDHCSTSWGIDSNIDIYMPGSLPYSATSFTIQWCILAEPLVYDSSFNGKNSAMSSNAGLSTSNISLHHNLYANAQRRNPRINFNAQKIELVNNLMYNIGGIAVIIGDGGALLNFIKNKFEQGSLTTSSNYIIITPVSPPSYAECQIYTLGNIGGERASEDDPEWDVVSDDYGSGNPASTDYQTLTPHSTIGEPIVVHELDEARALILANVGASLTRDSHDIDTIADVDAETGALIQWDSLTDGIDPSGSWPALDNFTSPTDTDDDGIPDAWENARGLDYQVADDDGYDLHDLYTNIEVYLMGLTGNPTVILDTLTLAGSAETSNPTLGIIGMNTLTLAGSAEAVNVAVDQVVSVNTLSIASSPGAIGVGAGAVSITASTLVLASSSEEIAVTPGQVSIGVSSLTVSGSAELISVLVPFESIIQMSALILASSIPAMIVVAIEIYSETGLSELVLTGSGTDSMVLFIEDIDVFVGNDSMVIEAPGETFEVSTGNDNIIVRTAK